MLKFIGGDLLVCDVPLRCCSGGVGMTSALTCRLVLHTKPHGAEWTLSNAKFSVHLPIDFVNGYKPNVDAAQCIEWISSLHRSL